MSEEFLEKIHEKESCVPEVIRKISGSRIPLLFYGAGLTAKYFYHLFLDHQIPITDVVVDEKFYRSGLGFEGREVKSLQKTLGSYDQVNVFLAFTTNEIDPHVKSLIDTGKVKEVFRLDDPAIFNGKKEFYDYSLVTDNSRILSDLHRKLSDDHSRKVLCAFINQRISWKLGYLDKVWTKDDYDPKGLFRYTQDEVYVDCGAYNGDTVHHFMKILQNSGGRYDCLIAFEPDKKNFLRLEGLRNEIRDLTCVNKGVWSETSQLRFSGAGTLSSSLSDQGEEVVDVESIDNALKGEKATYIKMDVEGAELQALVGARETIKKYRPKLAVCVYHKRDDLITIPQYLLGLVPEYKLYLRAHRAFSKELVLYATI